MPLYLLFEGVLIGFMVAVPVGPCGLLCINRALLMGALCGLASGLGVATADALAAGVAALGISLISVFLSDHQFVLRLVGGAFLCYLGFSIYATKPVSGPAPKNVNGLIGAYATAFLLTISNPATVLSFVAIYAGWQIESLSGHYFAAAFLSGGVFLGSSLWWIALFLGMTTFRDRFSLRVMWWVHRISGAAIATFGIIVLLSLSPLKNAFGVPF